MKTAVKKSVDALGIIAPTVCLVHCLATPILLTALPLVSASDHHNHMDNDATFHWIIVSICALAILPAFKNHRRFRVLALFALGAACVLLPAYVHLDDTALHIGIAVLGSACLVSANLMNRKYGQVTACCSVAHAHES